MQPDALGEAKIVIDKPGRIVVQTTSPSKQLLMVMESYHNGWTISEDGIPRSVIPVFGEFLGCTVNKGKHEIVFQFKPRSLSIGFYISFLGVFCSLIFFAFSKICGAFAFVALIEK